MGVRLAGELHPDLVLMDLRMQDLSGIEATRQIVERDPATRVLALTVASADADVTAALQAGACGFLSKDTEIDDIAVAIRAAADGAAWLSAKAAQVVLGQIRTAAVQRPGGASRIDQLSSREREVLRLVATGKKNSEIASELNISPRTAKNHVSSILAKLEVPSRVQAAVYAVRQGVSEGPRRPEPSSILRPREIPSMQDSSIPFFHAGLSGAFADQGWILLNSATLCSQQGTDDATTLATAVGTGIHTIDPWVPRASSPQLRHLRSEHGFGVQPVAVSVSDPRGAAMMPPATGTRATRLIRGPRARERSIRAWLD